MSGALATHFDTNIKVIDLGMFGPRTNNFDGQIRRARNIKSSMSHQCSISGVVVRGHAEPNKNCFLKMLDGKYYYPHSMTIT